jgi:SEC-C motif-containing protein
MRSRYTAFTLGNSAYLTHTHTPAPGDADPAELGRWAKSVHWLSLKILDAPADVDDAGEVTFACSYLERGVKVTLTERSRFARENGRWVYLDGTPKAVRQKVDRNAPCPCGSGRKFKQCHA